MVAEFKNCPDGIFRLVKELKIDNKEFKGGGYMRGSDDK